MRVYIMREKPEISALPKFGEGERQKRQIMAETLGYIWDVSKPPMAVINLLGTSLFVVRRERPKKPVGQFFKLGLRDRLFLFLAGLIPPIRWTLYRFELSLRRRRQSAIAASKT